MTITEKVQAKIKATQIETEWSGIPLRLRLAPLTLWAEQGRVPQHLATIYQQSLAGEKPDTSEPVIVSESDKQDWEDFRRRVIEYSAMEPLVTFGDVADTDAVKADELEAVAPGVLNFIYGYAVRVITPKKDEVSVDTLANFRQDEAGTDGTIITGVYSENLRAATVNAAAAGG